VQNVFSGYRKTCNLDNTNVQYSKLNYLIFITDVTLSKHKDETEQVIIQKINWLRLASTRVGNEQGGIYYHKSK